MGGQTSSSQFCPQSPHLLTWTGLSLGLTRADMYHCSPIHTIVLHCLTSTTASGSDQVTENMSGLLTSPIMFPLSSESLDATSLRSCALWCELRATGRRCSGGGPNRRVAAHTGETCGLCPTTRRDTRTMARTRAQTRP